MKISASIYSDKKRPLAEVIEDLVEHQVDMFHVDCNDDPAVFEDPGAGVRPRDRPGPRATFRRIREPR